MRLFLKSKWCFSEARQQSFRRVNVYLFWPPICTIQHCFQLSNCSLGRAEHRWVEDCFDTACSHLTSFNVPVTSQDTFCPAGQHWMQPAPCKTRPFHSQLACHSADDPTYLPLPLPLSLSHPFCWCRTCAPMQETIFSVQFAVWCNQVNN